MTRRLVPAMLTLLLAGACSGTDPDLVAALDEASAPVLFAPRLPAGEEPESFLVNTADDSVTLDYGDGFSPTLTLRRAPAGDLCDGRTADWDRCAVIDDDAVRLGFEEMDAVVVRRDGTELLWSNISFELPDEDYDSEEELLAAIEAMIDSYVAAAREATVVTAEELVDTVPDGRVGTP